MRSLILIDKIHLVDFGNFHVSVETLLDEHEYFLQTGGHEDVLQRLNLDLYRLGVEHFLLNLEVHHLFYRELLSRLDLDSLLD